jgi:hypothetical protein
LPGALSISIRPPSASSRSAIPWSPEPRGAFAASKPRPSSSTSKTSSPSPARSRMRAPFASAYFATFWSASRQLK